MASPPRVSAVRFARPTRQLEACATFYRDLLGFELLATFDGHAGYDGRIFGLPDQRTQLELIRFGNGPIPEPDAENALVIYVPETEMAALRSRLPADRLTTPENPYWVAAGALAVLDPDDWPVLFVPPERAAVMIEPFEGDRREIEPSFLLAEESQEQLDSYIDEGDIWVASIEGHIVGHVQVIPDKASWEVRNVAVSPEWQGQGVGRRLLDFVVERARVAGAKWVELATGTANIDNLRFYQRVGFRMTHVVPDFFSPANGYPEVDVHGIPLCDQVWLRRDTCETARRGR
jgi:GNAT superfamily N-acetyltransferase